MATPHAAASFVGAAPQFAEVRQIRGTDGSVHPKYVRVTWDAKNTLSGANVSLSSNEGTFAVATLSGVARNSIISLDHVIVETGVATVGAVNASLSVVTLDPPGTLGGFVDSGSFVTAGQVLRWAEAAQAPRFVHSTASDDVISVSVQVFGSTSAIGPTLSAGKLALVLRIDADSTDVKDAGLASVSTWS